MPASVSASCDNAVSEHRTVAVREKNRRMPRKLAQKKGKRTKKKRERKKKKKEEEEEQQQQQKKKKE